MIASSRSSRIAGNSLTYSLLVIICVIAVFPLFFTVSSSLKTAQDLMRNPAGLFPTRPTLRYYVELLELFNIGLYIRNSLIVCAFSVVISTVLSTFAAYSVVRCYGKRAKTIVRTLILTYMFPRIVLVVPYYIIFARFGLANTFTGLVIAYLSFTIPFSIYLLIGFFSAVPIEIEESALIDGASRFQVFRLIALPLTASGVVASAIFAFINTWNEFLYALILISSGAKKTVAVALHDLKLGETFDWGGMLAAAVLVAIPSLVFFFMIQKRIGAGMSAGAVKG